MQRRKELSCRKFTYKISILTLYVMGASSFLAGAAYRLIDAKTLTNVYIDLSASCYFTVANTFDLVFYIRKSCQKKHKLSKKYIYKYFVRIMYLIGALLFLCSSIYRLFDYLTDNTIFIDISAIGGFFIPNTMMFIVFFIKSIKIDDSSN